MVTLIDTKLRPLRLPEGYVTRPRLLAQLDLGLEQGLILISAPAGYGKTTLAADWLRQRPSLAAGWVSLDENDNDLDTFLRYLTTAVHRAFSQEELCTKTQALLNAPQPPPLETISNTLINDLAQLSHALVLVLDDYHVITDPAIQQVMAALVRYLPAALRLLIITRVDPALPLLARRRAKQLLLEVRAVDLRFAPAETRTILAHTSGAEVDEATAALLEEQTEGWIIGLQLAGLSLRGQQAPAALAQAFQASSHRLIMDFLLDEVLALQPRAVLEFLLKTAILEQLCDSLCEAVVAQGPVRDGETLLASLARSGLFLVSLDEEGVWYRYHPLLRELLQRRLAQEWGQAEIATLHRRAGMWLAARGFSEEALRHLLAAGDVEAAVMFIEAQRHEILNQGGIYRLARWLEMLPEEAVTRRSSLLQLKAWTLRWQAKFQAIPSLLQQAEAMLARETDMADGDSVDPAILLGERDVLRAELAFFQSEFGQSLAYAQSALDRLPRHYFFARGLAILFGLMAQQSLGQMEAALRQLNVWLDDEQLQDHTSRYLLLLSAGGIYGTIGDLRRLEQVGQFLLKLGLDDEKPLSITWAHHFLAHVYYQWDRLEEALDHWAAVPEWRYQANFRTYHEAMLGMALVLQSQGDEAQADQTLDTLVQMLLEMNQIQFAPEVEAFGARLALLRGDVGTAVHWVQTGAQAALMPLWFLEANELTRVKVLIAQGTAVTHREASNLLATCQQYADKTTNVWLLIQIWALRSLLAEAQGQQEAALTACERAVRLAEPGGYLRLFVELGTEMADLLAQLAQRGVAPAYIDRILAVFHTDQLPGAEAITERELEIVTLLEQGLSDKEIAGRLVISVLTVKKHNRNIYQKLGVTNRSQAVTKAKALNLIT